MLSKKYLNELMRYHEDKEAKEAKEAEEAMANAAKAALGKFLKEKNKNVIEEKNEIEFLF